MKLPALLIALATAVLISACAPLDVAAPKVETLTLTKTADIHKLEAGRDIYATSCTKCHGPARIDRRTDEKWTQKVLPTMCKWAHLTPPQIEALTTYILTARHALSEQAAHKGNS